MSVLRQVCRPAPRMRCVCHGGSERALHHTHGLVGCPSRVANVSDTALPFRGRDVPASQYLALHWLSSPLIHHPALDLKEWNGINHPAGHTARLPSPFAGSCGSRALRCLHQESFLVGSLCLLQGGLRHTWKRKGSCASPTGTGGSPRHPQEPPQPMMKMLLKVELGLFLLGQQYLTVTTPALPTPQISHTALVCRHRIGYMHCKSLQPKTTVPPVRYRCLSVPVIPKLVWAPGVTEEAQLKGTPMQLLAQFQP